MFRQPASLFHQPCRARLEVILARFKSLFFMRFYLIRVKSPFKMAGSQSPFFIEIK